MAPGMFCDSSGKTAVVGTTEDYWIDESDFVSTRDGFAPNNIGPHGFPKDWPAVYTKSKALKSLIGKNGKLGATRVHVVSAPHPDEQAKVAGLELTPVQSCLNAERVATKTGMRVEKGWVVYELFSTAGTSSGDSEFVAQKHWYNRTVSGEPVDFTPRGPDGSDASTAPLLLVEVSQATSKEKTVLSTKLFELHQRILVARGFKRIVQSPSMVPPPPRKITPIEGLASKNAVAPADAAGGPSAPTSTKKQEPSPPLANGHSEPHQRTSNTPVAVPCRVEPSAVTGRMAPQPPQKITGGVAAAASVAKPVKKTIDYSKFDNIEDSDEEREKAEAAKQKKTDTDPSSVTIRITQTPTEMVTLDDFRGAFKALLEKADPPTLTPNIEEMFKAFKSCPDTTDRALLDQACHAVEGISPEMMRHGLEGWKTGTSQMLRAMFARNRFDEARMWCIIRRLQMPDDPEPLNMHAWCLEEQWSRAIMQDEAQIQMPTVTGSKLVKIETYAESIQESLRAHLWRTIEIGGNVVQPVAYAGLAASLERSGKIVKARQVGKDGVKAGVWANEWQRPAHFVPTLLPRQPWHDPVTMEICGALEQAFPSIKEEFEQYMLEGYALKDVGIRSGEAMLVEKGSWKELPLFNSGRMDHEVCSKFPETIRTLTERCADSTGLAFCGGGEIAFRILSPGTKLKPHCSPTNVRLACQLGISVPLGAEPGISVGGESPRPWVDGKCIVFDDSFENFEELDEMADGDCVVLNVHFWHPAFQHKNDPDWKTKSLQETSGVLKVGSPVDNNIFVPMNSGIAAAAATVSGDTPKLF